MNALKDTISVCIATFNRKQLLQKSLLALCHQTLPTELFEVIVIDDGSSDGAGEMIKGLSLPYRLSYYYQPNQGLAAARNKGISKAIGQIILFLDDDIVALPRLLEEHVRLHCEDERAVVVGHLDFPPDLEYSTFLWYLDRINEFNSLLHKRPKGEKHRPVALTGNTSVRKEHLVAAGGYDEGFKEYGGEDKDLGYRLQKLGLNFKYAPGARAYHYHSKGLDAFCQGMISAGKQMVRILHKYPEIESDSSIDIVSENWFRLPFKKACQKTIFMALLHFPWIISLSRQMIRLADNFNLRLLSYPFYRITTQYYFGRGIWEGLREFGHLGAGRARKRVPVVGYK